MKKIVPKKHEKKKLTCIEVAEYEQIFEKERKRP